MINEIIVIDDNSDIRLLISGILKDKGFNVREAANYDQAISEINKKKPDVAVIDVKLDKGDNDGIDVLKHIKKIDDDVMTEMDNAMEFAINSPINDEKEIFRDVYSESDPLPISLDEKINKILNN